MLFLVLSSIFLRASETVRTAACRKQKQEGFPAKRRESLLFYQRERRVRGMRILSFYGERAEISRGVRHIFPLFASIHRRPCTAFRILSSVH